MAAAIEQGIVVVPIPGATAVITAVAASGLDTSSFWFVGFLPRKSREQLEKLATMAEFQGTLVFYEAPHRLMATLCNIQEVLGNRRAVVARELTKIHEEFIRGWLSEIVPELSKRELKGEFTVVVEGTTISIKNNQNSTKFDINKLLEGLNSNSSSLRQQLKEIAKLTGKSTQELYQLYLSNKKRGGDSSSS